MYLIIKIFFTLCGLVNLWWVIHFLPNYMRGLSEFDMLISVFSIFCSLTFVVMSITFIWIKSGYIVEYEKTQQQLIKEKQIKDRMAFIYLVLGLGKEESERLLSEVEWKWKGK